MKTIKKMSATLVAGIMSLPYLLMAQDEGNYIDNMQGQDSTYLDQEMVAEGAQNSGSGTTVIIIIAVVVVIAVIAFLSMRKKKK